MLQNLFHDKIITDERFKLKISFNQTSSPNVRDTNGYGYAAKMCKQSLVELGHEVTWRDSTADVEINFIQPENWHWTGPYRIAYLPWESTEFRPGWIDSLNEVDEVWTPSPVIGQWMVDSGLKKEPKIYQHGVESLWEPIVRPPGRFNVLHHGAEALRKGGNETIQAFMATLWDENATLTMKMLLNQFNIHDTDKIKIRGKRIPIDELVGIYHESDLFCYPSYGEGFGLAPLQAMATGMPVLITKGWAPYEYLLPPEMLIESHLIDTPWPAHHPGMVFQPHQDDLEYKMKNIFENCEYWKEFSFNLSTKVHEDYNWLNLTEKAFSHLV